MRTKTFDVKIKAAGDDLEEGQFTGYASVFDNVDSYGDVVMKGAFAKSLSEYGPNGEGVPCYWAHQMSNPHLNLGSTVEAREDDHGLFVKVQLDLETDGGKQVHRLLQQKRVSQMSFAFDVVDGGWGERDGKQVYELRELKLHEVSVVPVGANQETELLAVKDALTVVKAGRAISAKNEDKLQQAAALIGEVLSSIESSDDEKSSGPDVLEGAQEKVQSGGQPAVVLAHTILKTL